MRFAHVRPVSVSLVTGSVLIVSAMWFSVAAAPAADSSTARPNVQPTINVVSGTAEQCEPLTLPKPSPSPSPTPSKTPSPTNSPTPTVSVTPSNTPTPTDTGTPTGTSTPTSTATPTDTVTPTSSATVSSTATSSNTATPTDPPTSSKTATPTDPPTSKTATPASTGTSPAPSGTSSPSQDPGVSPSATTDPSPSPSTSPSVTSSAAPGTLKVSGTAKPAAAPANTAHKTATTQQTATAQKTTATQQASGAKTATPAKTTVRGTDPAASAAVAASSGSTPVPVKGSSTQVRLCVEIARSQATVELGHAAQWTVSAWTQNGNVPDAVVRLVSAPASMTALFNFGCGSEDGTASCDLGEVAAGSAPRQLAAQVAVPATATTGTSVQLSVVASAAHLSKDPRATAGIPITAAAGGGTGGSGGSGGNPVTTTTPLPIGNLPYVTGAGGSGSTLSPGGNAGGLFPTVNPASGSASGTQGQKASAKTVANTSALPLGAPVVGAQLVGLGVLALAFVLAVTRMSIRRRPATATAARSQPTTSSPADKDKDKDAKEG
jgi:hypothetical protein